MDRMYRWTRHVYDWTRRYYLFGRDRLIDRIADHPPGDVLEVGCGTARNLRRLHRLAPDHRLYGMDASTQMLDTARRGLRRDGASSRIRLAHGLASDVGPDMFGRTAPFDVVFCSYVLSMIPNHDAAIRASLQALRPGGTFYIVDFWDQADLPAPLARALQGWLGLFDVHHRPALLDTLLALEDRGTVRLHLETVGPRYAYLAALTRTTMELAPGDTGTTPPAHAGPAPA